MRIPRFSILLLCIGLASAAMAQNTARVVMQQKTEQLQQSGPYDQAIGTSDPALQTAKDTAWVVMLQRAEQLHQEGQYAQAILAAEDALQMSQEALGYHALRTSEPMYLLASLYQETGRYAEAESVYTQVLAIRERALGSKHPSLINALTNIGETRAMQNRDDDAMAVFTRALDIQAKKYGMLSSEYVALLRVMANFYNSHGKPEQARVFENREKALRDSMGYSNSAPPREPDSPRLPLPPREPDIPRFPWPPPEPSSFMVIPRDSIVERTRHCSLGDVAGMFEVAFDRAGYIQRSYYWVPKGFALVTQMEQFNDDGTSREEPARFSLKYTSPRVFSLGTFFKAIFHADPGRYRIIVFIVTDTVVTLAAPIADTLARTWLQSGMLTLPSLIGQQIFSDTYKCSVLIYEYQRPSAEEEPVFNRPGHLDGKSHLVKSHLWKGWIQ